MYHCSANGSDKVWGCTTDGFESLVVYGKRGTKLNFYRKLHNSDAVANMYLSKKITEKSKKQYAYYGEISFSEDELSFA